MITLLLLHKERLVRIWELAASSETRRELLDAIQEVDRLVERQVDQNREHREAIKIWSDEVDALVRKL